MAPYQGIGTAFHSLYSGTVNTATKIPNPVSNIPRSIADLVSDVSIKFSHLRERAGENLSNFFDRPRELEGKITKIVGTYNGPPGLNPGFGTGHIVYLVVNGSDGKEHYVGIAGLDWPGEGNIVDNIGGMAHSRDLREGDEIFALYDPRDMLRSEKKNLRRGHENVPKGAKPITMVQITNKPEI